MPKKKRREGRPIQYDDDFHKMQREVMRMYRQIRKEAKKLRKAK